MAVNKIARKSSKFRVVFTVPDFCWPPPPAPPSVPPIPFPLFADLGGAKTVAKDVRLNRKPAFVFNASKTDKTYGDEIALPGRKGVKSRTATKPAWPMRHSSSVKIRKRYIVRTGDMFHMNGKFSKRLPPKTCLSCKGAVGAGRPVNPIHGLKFWRVKPTLPLKVFCRWYGAAAIIPTKTVPAGSARVGAYLAANALSAMRPDWPISTR